jgi:hypothetical protein
MKTATLQKAAPKRKSPAEVKAQIIKRNPIVAEFELARTNSHSRTSTMVLAILNNDLDAVIRNMSDGYKFPHVIEATAYFKTFATGNDITTVKKR